jgi:hypothetical protein
MIPNVKSIRILSLMNRTHFLNPRVTSLIIWGKLSVLISVALLLGVGAAVGRSSAYAAQVSPLLNADPACSRLAAIDFSTTQDAPFLVTSASISGEVGKGAYCRVTGYVMPEITFEIRLPLSDWNHKFILVGNGGWAWHKDGNRCIGPVARGYACIVGDAGHQTNGGLWMQGAAQPKIDWGYRATHVTTVAGKALTQDFYGDAPKLSLMLGCSTGGYQALVEAQRFPWDFAGIVALAPDIDEGDLSMRTTWAARQLIDADDQPVFSKHDLEVLHQGALHACDTLDGVRDAIIGDPQACHFDPRDVLCGDGRDPSACLSERQVAAATRIYQGPRTSSGAQISTAGPFPGSEMGWPNMLEDVKFADNYFRFALADLPRDGFPASKFDFDTDYKRLGLGGEFIDSNPDLRHFRDAGGKLIMVQGGNDVTEQAHAALDYYEMVERVSGGRQATQAFARLFLVPGMSHCSGGDGAFVIDYLTPIDEWVGEDRAPGRLVGAHVPEWVDGEGAVGYEGGMLPLPANIHATFTRPIYPYPLYARYSGHGDANDAGSFVPAERR